MIAVGGRLIIKGASVQIEMWTAIYMAKRVTLQESVVQNPKHSSGQEQLSTGNVQKVSLQDISVGGK